MPRPMRFRKTSPSRKTTSGPRLYFRGPNGLYYHSTVAPSHSHDDFSLVTRMPPGHKLAAIIHSHPGTDSYGLVFSPKDLDTADRLKVPSFVRFSDNQIRKYVPGRTSTQKTTFSGDRFGVKTARGDSLDPEPPDESNVGNVAGSAADPSVTVPPP